MRYVIPLANPRNPLRFMLLAIILLLHFACYVGCRKRHKIHSVCLFCVCAETHSVCHTVGCMRSLVKVRIIYHQCPKGSPLVC